MFRPWRLLHAPLYNVPNSHGPQCMNHAGKGWGKGKIEHNGTSHRIVHRRVGRASNSTCIAYPCTRLDWLNKIRRRLSLCFTASSGSPHYGDIPSSLGANCHIGHYPPPKEAFLIARQAMHHIHIRIPAGPWNVRRRIVGRKQSQSPLRKSVRFGQYPSPPFFSFFFLFFSFLQTPTPLTYRVQNLHTHLLALTYNVCTTYVHRDQPSRFGPLLSVYFVQTVLPPSMKQIPPW
ncbi:hypothetical protein SODALDRAFT_162896 [Sodiomyces alkalinus F11]|uniref:Uncharacterized protein n=1 Tax=Sodiomyces alkalinus (strain CBS 110278 / VKM F-3762 / F11) TaxID=1314773 RepID=A0A3N2PVC8_SODAK|nr:hypothetical protein SODALDRAFT_162896 [Sodiomyces alkalinus F11]ROT38461.1 hypothetical protein SODALDRAFT_162896 [Sodiomyces alkalinus F11]